MVYINKKQLQAIQKQAEANGMTVNEYIIFLNQRYNAEKDSDKAQSETKNNNSKREQNNKTLVRQEEFVLTPEEDRICIGVACKLKNDDEYKRILKEQVKEAINETLKDAIEVAKIQRKHPSFQEMLVDAEVEEELNSEIIENENDEEVE